MVERTTNDALPVETSEDDGIVLQPRRLTVDLEQRICSPRSSHPQSAIVLARKAGVRMNSPDDSIAEDDANEDGDNYGRIAKRQTFILVTAKMILI